jgi:hypothetical protein
MAMNETLYEEQWYQTPTTSCPFCGAPLVVFNARDEIHEVNSVVPAYYGAEVWACGTKRLGRIGPEKTQRYYKPESEKAEKTVRAGTCFEKENKDLRNEAGNHSWKLREQREKAEAAEKELAETRKKLEGEIARLETAVKALTKASE